LSLCVCVWAAALQESVALYKAALREELSTPLNPRISKAPETHFREARGGADTSETLLAAD